MHTMDFILYCVDSVTYAAKDLLHNPIVEELATIVLIPLGVVFTALLAVGFVWAAHIFVSGLYNKIFNHNEDTTGLDEVM